MKRSATRTVILDVVPQMLDTPQAVQWKDAIMQQIGSAVGTVIGN